MNSPTENLKLVVLDSPYDAWEDPRTQYFFNKIVGLKLEGYKTKYAYGVLPLDTTDFVCIHHIFCKDTKSGLEPIMGYRSMPLSRCKLFRMTYPAMVLCQTSQAHDHEQAVKKILSDAESRKTEISHDSSWTIKPEFRKDRVLVADLKGMFEGTNCLYHRDYQIPEITGSGSVRLKTDEYFLNWGYQRLRDEKNQELGIFNQATLLDEQIQLFHLKDFSARVLAEAERWISIWENRIILSNPDDQIRTIRKLNLD